MARVRETVLYYNPGTPEAMKHVALMKSVLIRMGVHIRNVGPEQVLERVGFLAGIPGYESALTGEEGERPMIPDQVLVLKQFSSGRIDELLAGLRRAGVPRINHKAVLTEKNCGWTFYQLYQELDGEHRALTGAAGAKG